MFQTRKIAFISGAICGLAFAPIYFLPGIFALSVLCLQIATSKTRKQAMIKGYLFGFGFFLSTLYWISFGISVYIEQFWWAIPFALFGLPAFLSFFTAAQAALAWQFKYSGFYHIIFCFLWILMEWVISWIFTGLPWSMLAYTMSISGVLTQSASIFGPLGLSFIIIYIGSSFFSKKQLHTRLLVSLIMCISLVGFGCSRLNNNPTKFSNLTVRVVQPSIPQTDKWNIEEFWDNLNQHIHLSQKDGNPDIIIWSEAALTAPYYYKPISEAISSAFTKNNQVLIFGGVNDNQKQGDDFELYSSLIAIDEHGKLLFDHHKSHLVPFGEYIPYAQYLPLKKLTPGLIDYTAGERSLVELKQFQLNIQPMICYESIFADETRISNQNVDLIVNVTNDAWYGNSSGPYQHFEISRMRAIENGLPMIRSANNGISAIVDPLGRTVKKLNLNQKNTIDGYIPLKISFSTIYSKFGRLTLVTLLIFVLILQLTVKHALKLIFTTKNRLR